MDLDFGPLIDLDTEQALIAAVLFDGRLMPHAEHVKPDDFGDLGHRRIWSATLAEYRSGHVPSWSLVRNRLAAEESLEEVGGREYLLTLARNPVGAVDFMVRDWALAVRGMALRRRYLALAEEITKRAKNMDRAPEEVIAETVGDLHRMTKEGTQAGQTKRAVAEGIVEAIAKPLPRYSTGLVSLDEVLGGGLFASKLYGVAARKKVGKTILAGTISHNLNERGVKHLFIALEMSPAEVEQRNIARALRINSIAFLKRDMPSLPSRAGQYAVTVDDNMIYEAAPGATLDDLRGMVGRAIVQHGITGVILDYWQLVGGKAKNETEEYHLRNVAQWLADTCRKEGLWALVMAQVNQTGNTRGGEGLKLACDIYFTLHREKGSDGAWLEMEESRYVPYRSVGGELEPGLIMNHCGPFFEDAAGFVPGEDMAAGGEG